MAFDSTQLDRSAMATIEVDSGSGWEDFGICKEGTLRVNGEEIPHWNVQSYPFTKDAVEKGNVSIEIEFIFEQVASIDIWNKVLHGGSMTTTSAGSDSVTDESVVLNGEVWKALQYANDFKEDCSVVIQDDTDTTTYTEGTDYYLDRRTGHIRRISGGSIGNGDTVHVDYDYNTYDGKYFEIHADDTPTEYKVRFIKYFSNGDRLRVQHTKTILSTPIEFALAPGEEGEWAGVTGKLTFLKDSGGEFGELGRWEHYTP